MRHVPHEPRPGRKGRIQRNPRLQSRRKSPRTNTGSRRGLAAIHPADDAEPQPDPRGNPRAGCLYHVFTRRALTPAAASLHGLIRNQDGKGSLNAGDDMAELRTNSKIEAEYRARTKRSAELYERARHVIPAGLTHDSRTLLPYPIYAARASGPRKWGADGNEYVDYFGGHGALLLGHSHPAVVTAVTEQITRGTHWGSSHELEVRWAELVNRLIPCAERVRFTASGTEASHLALRLARAFTGKPKVIRFVGHFHGWHDQVAAGSNSHYDGSVPAGVLPQIVEHTILLPADDPARVAETLNQRDDVAAVIFEPSGASWGQVPLPPGFIAKLREITRETGVLLIFDEVITGFRWSRGGAQARIGITPDMCVLAKIVAGGLPGGAVAGRADVMDQLDADAAKRD